MVGQGHRWDRWGAGAGQLPGVQAGGREGRLTGVQAESSGWVSAGTLTGVLWCWTAESLWCGIAESGAMITHSFEDFTVPQGDPSQGDRRMSGWLLKLVH